MSMMAEEQKRLTQAVFANFDDDGPRLILADWYEENDDPLRASYVRNAVKMFGLFSNELTQAQKAWVAAEGFGEEDYYALTHKLWRKWLQKDLGYHHSMNVAWDYTAERGFVWTITIRNAAYLTSQFARKVAQRTAITRIKLRDNNPVRLSMPPAIGTHWRWYFSDNPPADAPASAIIPRRFANHFSVSNARIAFSEGVIDALGSIPDVAIWKLEDACMRYVDTFRNPKRRADVDTSGLG